jgi:hypothetical protein
MATAISGLKYTPGYYTPKALTKSGLKEFL